jgi:hypothetical protein
MCFGNGRVEDEKEWDGRRLEIILRKRDLREFHMQVNISFLTGQEVLPIQWVMTLIQGLPHLISPVLPWISHIHYLHLVPVWNPKSLFLVYSSTMMAEHKAKSSLSICPWLDYKLTPRTVYTKYSIHQIQHRPKMVCLPSILTMTSQPVNVASGSGVSL